MILISILFLARRVLRRTARLETSRTIFGATWHLLVAVPGTLIVALFSICSPSIQHALAQQSANHQPSTIASGAATNPQHA